jgi:hypothetical protein
LIRNTEHPSTNPTRTQLAAETSCSLGVPKNLGALSLFKQQIDKQHTRQQTPIMIRHLMTALEIPEAFHHFRVINPYLLQTMHPFLKEIHSAAENYYFL